MKKIISIFLMTLLLLLPINKLEVKAVTATDLLLNGQAVTGTIETETSSDLYKITTTKPGQVKFNITTQMGYVDIALLKSDATSVVKSDTVFNDYNNNLSYNLDAGTYYLKIIGDGYEIGNYTIISTFLDANNIDVEPNNSIAQANAIAIDGSEKTGFFSYTDLSDYYKIQIKTTGTLAVYINESQIGFTNTKLYDATGKEVEYTDYDYDSLGYATGFDIKAAGTYFIKFENPNADLDNSGVYKFKLGFTSNTFTVNTITNKSTTLTGHADPYNTIRVNINGKAYTAKTDLNGYFNVTIPVTISGTAVTVDNIESIGWIYYRKSMVVVTGAANPVPTKPVVNVVNNKATVVTGKTSPNVDVYAQIGTAVYSAKSDANGNYSIKIPVLNAGTIINVTAKNSYGVSAATAVAVTSVAPNRPIVNAVNNKATVVTGKTEANIYVYAQIGTAVYSAKSDAYGNYSIKIPVLNAGTIIYVTAKNTKGTSAITAVAVTSVAPNRPIVNAVGNKATVVTGKTEANIYVYAQIGTAVYSAKSDAYGNYIIKIPVLNAGAIINVTAKNTKGTSAITAVAVVKVAPNKPVVATVHSTSTAITGTAEVGTTVYAKIGTKVYAVKANTNGQFAIAIPKQLVNTQILVSAKDSLNRESFVQTIIVVK